MTPSFVQAQPQDLPQIVAIYNQAIPGQLATADLTPVAVADRQAWFAAHTHDRPLDLILVNDQIAGWISLSDFYGRPAYHATVEVSIYLDEHFHHQGLGQQALSYVIANAPTHGIHTLLAFVFGHNQASQALFTRNGFTRWGHLPAIADMAGTPRDLDILGRHLETHPDDRPVQGPASHFSENVLD